MIIIQKSAVKTFTLHRLAREHYSMKFHPHNLHMDVHGSSLPEREDLSESGLYKTDLSIGTVALYFVLPTGKAPPVARHMA